MGANNKSSFFHQFGGMIIAIGVMVLLFYKDDLKRIKENHQQIPNQQSIENTTVNGLKEIEDFSQQQKILESQYAQPFVQNTMNNFPLDGSVKGSLTFTTKDKDAVFLVRDKMTNTLHVVVQLPKYSKAETLAPLGEYTIEYATGDGEWQGLDRFWGYSTQFYKSNHQHVIYRTAHGNGYTTYGTGITLNTMTGQTPEKINKDQFIQP